MASALPSVAVSAVQESNALLATMLIYERNAIDTLNLVNTTLLNSSQQVYIDIINKATAEVLTESRRMTSVARRRSSVRRKGNPCIGRQAMVVSGPRGIREHGHSSKYRRKFR